MMEDNIIGYDWQCCTVAVKGNERRLRMWNRWMKGWIYYKRCMFKNLTRVSCFWNCYELNNQKLVAVVGECAFVAASVGGTAEIMQELSTYCTPWRHCVLKRNVEYCLHAAWQSTFCSDGINGIFTLLLLILWWYAAAAAASSPFKALHCYSIVRIDALSILSF